MHFPIPHVFNGLAKGSPWLVVTAVWLKKTRMVHLPDSNV